MAAQKGTPKKAWPRWAKAFLDSLATTGVVLRSAESAKASRSKAYKLREHDHDFAEQWDKALEDASDLLIEEARRRAYNGVADPVIYQGELMGQWVDMVGNPVSKDTPCARLIPLTVTKYSDTLLIFLIKGQRPEYRDQMKHELTGKDGKDLVVRVLGAGLSTADL